MGFGIVPLNSTTAVMVVVSVVGVPTCTATQRLNPANVETGRRPLVQSVGSVPEEPSKLRVEMAP